MIDTHEQYLAAKQSFYELNRDPFADTADMDAVCEQIMTYEREVLGLKPAFQVDSEDTLRWYIGRVTDAQSKQARIQAQADAMKADLQREIDGLEFRFGEQAARVARTLLDGKKKSVKFLEGTAQFRKVPGRVSADGDISSFLSEELRSRLYVSRLDSAELNRVFKVVGEAVYDAESGEQVTIPGLNVKPEGETFSIKAGKE